MPASVAVWQLPSTEPVLKQQMECSLSLPPVPRVVTTPDVPAIPSVPKNTPVSQVSHAPSLATPPLPSVSVSWTQHWSSASPSPSQVVSGHLWGGLASEQHNVSSHPHTGPRDITTLPLQVAQVLNEVLNDVSPNFVHCVRSFERSFV